MLPVARLAARVLHVFAHFGSTDEDIRLLDELPDFGCQTNFQLRTDVLSLFTFLIRTGS
jgi:hypothetical protein